MRGGATRPHQAVIAKRTMAAIAVRSATDQRGGKLWRITLFTGQVMPHVSTTAASSTAARRRDTPPCASSGAGRPVESGQAAEEGRHSQSRLPRDAGPPHGPFASCLPVAQRAGGPPSTMMVSPVMKDEASEARKMHGYAISSTLPQRPMPTRLATVS